MKLQKQNASFVDFSDIRSIDENVGKALDILCNYGPNWSWGDNNRTLIDIDSFLGELESSLNGEDGFYSREDDDVEDGVCIEDLIQKIRDSIPEDTDYVDLEN